MNEGCSIDPALSLCLSVQLFSHVSTVSHFKTVALKSLRNLLHGNRDNTSLCLLLEMLGVSDPLGTKTL